MSSVSQILRHTRESKGISLEEVAQRTYIKLPYLNALEEGEIDKLPAPVYIHGYIRQYAKLLGLNGSELVLQYQQDLSRPSAPAKLAPAPVPPAVAEPLAAKTYQWDAAAVPARDVVEASDVVEVDIRPAARSIMPPDLRETSLNRRPVAPSDGTPSFLLPESSAEPAKLPDPTWNAEPIKSADPAEARPAFLAPDIVPRRLEAMPAAAMEAAPQEISARRNDPILSLAEISTRRLEPSPTVQEIQAAKQQAHQIIASAQREAQELRIAAERYADQVLAQLESEVNRSLQTVRNGRAFLQSRRRRLQEG